MADEDATAFVLRLGRALHALGYSSHRIEELLADAAQRLGLEGQFFTTPTSIFAAFGAQERQRTFLVRVEPGDLHLERLGRVQEIAEEVLGGTKTPRMGLAALDALDRETPRWGTTITTVAFGIAGGCAARLLGGGDGLVALVLRILRERAEAERGVRLTGARVGLRRGARGLDRSRAFALCGERERQARPRGRPLR